MGIRLNLGDNITGFLRVILQIQINKKTNKKPMAEDMYRAKDIRNGM